MLEDTAELCVLSDSFQGDTALIPAAHAWIVRLAGIITPTTDLNIKSNGQRACSNLTFEIFNITFIDEESVSEEVAEDHGAPEKSS